MLKVGLGDGEEATGKRWGSGETEKYTISSEAAGAWQGRLVTGSPARSPPSCPLCWVIQPLLLIFIVPASPSTPGPKREAVQ